MTTAAREGIISNNNDNNEQDDITMNESVMAVTIMIIDDVDDNATDRKHPTKTITTTTVTSTSRSKILSSLPLSFQMDDRVLCIGQSTGTSTSTSINNKKKRNNNNTVRLEYFEAVIRDSRYEFNNDNSTTSNDCNMLLSTTTISGDDNDCNDFNDSLTAIGATGSRYWNYLVHYIGWNKRWDRWIPYQPPSADRDRDGINANDAKLLNLPILPDTIEIRQYLKDRKQFQCNSSNNNDENKNFTLSTGSSGNNIEMDSILSNTTNSTHSINGNNKRLKVTSSSTSPNKRSKTARSSSNNNNNNRSSSSVSSEDVGSSLVYSDYCELPLSLKTILINENNRITRCGNRTPYGYDNVNEDDDYVDQENATTSTSNNNNNLTTSTTTSKYDTPPRLVHVLPASVPVQKVIDHFRKKKIKELRHTINSSSSSSNNNTGTSTGANMNSTNKKVKVKQQQQSFESTTTTGTATSSLLLTESDIDSFCTGILQLFEASLSKCLLYPQERPQYEFVQRKLQKRKQKEQQQQQPPKQNENDSTTNSTNQLTEIYGCEYLLRLFVQLPILLQPSAEEFLQIYPSPESALAVLSNSDTCTDKNNSISNNNITNTKSSLTTTSTTTTTFPILNNPLVLGPLLVELLVLLQKNKQSLFKLVDNYRSPIYGKEWLDWEYTVYIPADKKKQSKK